MHDRESGHERDSDLDQRHPGAARDSEHERNEQYETNLEKDWDADDERDDHYCPVHAPFAEKVDQGGGDARRSAGFCHHFAKHGAESDDDGDKTEDVSDAVAKRFDRGERRHPRGHAHCQRDGD